jgi:hypothetical protein
MTTEQIKNFMEAKLKVGDYVTLKGDDCDNGDTRILCFDPVGEVREVLSDGTYRVGNKNSRDDHGEGIFTEDEITKFLLWVDFQGEAKYFARFDDFDRRLDLIGVRDLYSGDVEYYHEDYLGDGLYIIKDPLEFLEYQRRMGQHYESVQNVAAMREVSKQGVMEHFNKLNPNTKGKIMSYISGYNVGLPNEKAHMKILQEYMTRPRGTPGAGVNMRYGKKMPVYVPPTGMNKVLENGPLPYGPTEANFIGGAHDQVDLTQAQKLFGKFVIPREKFWNMNQPLLYHPVKTTRHGKRKLNMEHKLEEYFFFDDVPIWLVDNVFKNGDVEVVTDLKYGPFRSNKNIYKAVNPNDITEFYVMLKEGGNPNGALGEPWEERIGRIIGHDERAELWEVQVRWRGGSSVYHKDDLKFVDLATTEERIKELKGLQMVSKQGFLPSSIPTNIESAVLTQFVGHPKTHTIPEKIRALEELKMPPKHVYNIALKKGRLPHGPKESDFMAGGKRKSRSKLGTQMARRGTRRSSRGIFSRLYSPIGHLLSAGKESVGAVTNTAKGVVGEGIHGLDKIGRSVTKHANMAVKDVFTRKGGKRKARGTRKSRKSRRTTRRR